VFVYILLFLCVIFLYVSSAVLAQWSLIALAYVYHGKSLFYLSLVLKENLAGCSNLGWRLFCFMA
jgi:hypothetical protein